MPIIRDSESSKIQRVDSERVPFREQENYVPYHCCAWLRVQLGLQPVNFSWTFLLD